MKKIVFYLLLSCSFILLCVASCGQINEMDTEAPSISTIIVNDNDTVRLSKTDSIIINKPGFVGDTLFILGHRLYFSALFKDNEALSSYRINIHYDTSQSPVSLTDTLYRVTDSWRTIYNKKIAEVLRQSDITIPDTISRVTVIDGLPITTRLAVREGNYFLKVWVLDKAGNVDSIQQKIKLLNRKTIIGNRPS